MRRRHVAALLVETMEGRVVLSTVNIHLSPSATAQLHKVGNNLKTAATSVQNELAHLFMRRASMPAHAQWQTQHSHPQHTSKTLFGIPWLKI
jgi:hypothetical protein